MEKPFRPDMNLLDWACPISEVLARVASAMAELELMKETRTLLNRAQIEEQ
jgi:hypothetical protein